jgi:ATP-dependent DNA helicase DinG
MLGQPHGAGLWATGGPVDRACQALSIAYQPRDSQQIFAGAVEAALQRQAAGTARILPLEAATGVGKTLAYLVPGAVNAARTRSKILVSTHTIALGVQILHRDGLIAQEVVASMTNRRPRLAHMRGRSHFVSPSRARAMANLMRDDGLPRSSWQPYLDMVETADTAIEEAGAALGNDQLDDDAQAIVEACLLDRLEEAVGTSIEREDVCLLSSSPEAELAVHRLSRRLADTADILITTHAYTALCLARRALFQSGEEPFDLLVVDEADQWAGDAASVSWVRCSIASIRRSIESVISAACHRANAEVLIDLATQAVSLVDDLAALAPEQPDRAIPIEPGDKALALLGRLTKQIDRVAENAARRRSHTAAAVDAMSAQADDLRRLQNALESNQSNFWTVRWTTSRVEGAPSIGLVGRAPGRLLKRLWAPAELGQPLARTILLTSATLSTPGFGKDARWRSIEIATGADPTAGNVLTDLAASVQPRQFGQLRVRFADPRAPVPRVGQDGSINPEALHYAAAVIREAHRDSTGRDGRTLVLVPAYADVERLDPLVPGALAHAPGVPMQDILQQYRATPGCCLITPGAWVGADLPGLIQNLVIPRLPFVPQEPGEEFGAHALSQVLTKLAQGIGRAIRCPTDDAVLWFADPRMSLPDAVVERTGLLPSPHANPIFLAAIPERFRSLFAGDEETARIGVLLDGAELVQQPAERGAPRRRIQA